MAKTAQKISSVYPKISVVTVVYNGVESIFETVKSVTSQDYPALEYVVIDGASTDGTVELLNKSKGIDVFVSEPDQGISHAMNKGASLSSGDYILYIHADDKLSSSSVLTSLFQNIQGEPDIIAGSILFQHPNHSLLSRSLGFNWLFPFRNTMRHQAILCHRRVFSKVGGFDQAMKVSMDYDFFFRAKKAGFNVLLVDSVVSEMGAGGVSSDTSREGLASRLMEERLVHFRHGNLLFRFLIYPVFWALYLPYKLFFWRPGIQ